MEFRSSNAGIHIGNDIIANTNSSYGIHLTQDSTYAYITAAGDDANVGVRLAGKGSGQVQIGNSSCGVRLAGATAFGISSTGFFTRIERYVVEFTPPDLLASTSVSSTFTVTGLTTNSALVFTPRSVLHPSYNVRASCSTANELRLHFSNSGGSTLGAADSTNRGILIAIG